MDQWRLAIDFGTTNTAAAIVDQDRPVPLRLSSSADQMPSGVLARPDGSLLVGEAAANEAAVYLGSFEPNPKYRLGEPAVFLGDRDWSPVELVAAVLGRVRDKARAVTSTGLEERVVLTHPAAWQRHLQDRLEEAALLAGFTDVKLVSEPVAAARWYAARHRTNGSTSPTVIDKGATIAVFDFGGGTCDVAVLRAADQQARDFDVLASGGEPYLGGEELDRVIMDWTLDQLRESDGAEAAEQVRKAREGRDWFTFRDAVRRAKHTLSEAERATVPVVLGDIRKSLPIRRAEFNELVAPHLDRAMRLTSRVLEAAQTTPGDLAVLPDEAVAMYLTGGSATIPALHEHMRDMLQRDAARIDDPKTVVPRGALVAPRAGIDHVGEAVEPESDDTASLFHGDLDTRRKREDDLRPDGRDNAVPQRIVELEHEIARLRAELERQRRDAAQPSPPPTPHTPTPPAAPATRQHPVPTRTRPGPVQRLVGRLLWILGLVGFMGGLFGILRTYAPDSANDLARSTDLAMLNDLPVMPEALGLVVIGWLVMRGGAQAFRPRNRDRE